jgi:hypothetical protein
VITGVDIQYGQKARGIRLVLGIKLLLRKYVNPVCHACQTPPYQNRRDVITRLLTSLASVAETVLGKSQIFQELGTRCPPIVKRTANVQMRHQMLIVTGIKRKIS